MPAVNIADEMKERHRRARAGFVMQGTSLSAWCKARGVKHQNARKALNGMWTGPKAAALVEEILKVTGVRG